MTPQSEAPARNPTLFATPSDLELVITFPGSTGVYVRGVVRSVRAETGCVLGIQFTNLPAKALDAIRGYVTGRGRRHSGNFKVG